MTKQLKVTYFKDRCVGTGACMAQDPKHFKVISGKANLAGGDPSHGNKFILEKEFNDDANSCNILKVVHVHSALLERAVWVHFNRTPVKGKH